MTHAVKPRRNQRAPTSPPGRTPAGVASGVDDPVGADGRAAATRVNIESVADNKPGSVQALPPAQLPSGVAGFIESTDDADGDAHLPPCLEPT